jgi:hypothetical protein
MKRLLIVLLAAVMAISSLPLTKVAAASEPDYASSMRRLMDLGIFSATSPDKMDLNNAITREQLACVIILMNGQEDKASLYQNTSQFSDVAANRWSSGYIGAAVKLGYMKALSDGLFHPTDKVTFSQAAVLFGDLLRYKAYNLSGSYPDNYLNLLKNLGILNGIAYTANGSVTRGQMALMLDRLMQTKVFATGQNYIDTLGIYTSLIVLENSVTNKNADPRRILTDIGVYYMDEALAVPAAGKKFMVRIRDEKIVKMAPADLTFSEISVKYATNGKILSNSGETYYLPSNLTYYYKGAPTSFDVVNKSIKTNSSVVMGKKSDGTGYGVLFDPVTSDPKVIEAGTTPTMLESLYGGKTIDREGKYISASQIENDDVVYEITDIWGRNSYVVIYANHVSGEITAIIPNKVSPTGIAVDGKVYPLSKDFPLEKLIGQGSIEVDQTCRLLLDDSGNAVDIIQEGDSDNKHYALVLNAYDKKSTNSEDYGTNYHYVSLLHYNGSKKVYLTEKDMINEKGRLVQYKVTALGKDDAPDTVELTCIEYSGVNVSRVLKEDRMIDNSWVTNDVVIFNLVHNIYGTDSIASVLKFSDLPNGALDSAKVKYLHKTGDFQDIDLMVCENILDEGISFGIVTQVTTYWDMVNGAVQTITVLINGEPYTFQDNSTGIFVGSVLKLRTLKGQIMGIESIASPTVSGNKVEAADSSRVRINGVTYNYKAGVAILKYEDNTWKKAGTNEINKTSSRYISVYLDKPLMYGGKVVLITIR